ncbi:hypothetical protein CEXT_701741 [Caerostris extrusa]|uniref:Uncharacterized protein n=1 Tax=Caerostris extrusa TaxID=172846 RepID=A0AAV4Y2D1_CAEEX|nr:hypothetical protein CEXT_701741 [Caerostris extrusa]
MIQDLPDSPMRLPGDGDNGSGRPIDEDAGGDGWRNILGREPEGRKPAIAPQSRRDDSGPPDSPMRLPAVMDGGIFLAQSPKEGAGQKIKAITKKNVDEGISF